MVDGVGNKPPGGKVARLDKIGRNASKSLITDNAPDGYNVLEKRLREIVAKHGSGENTNKLLVTGLIEFLCNDQVIDESSKEDIERILLSKIADYSELRELFDTLKHALGSID